MTMTDTTPATTTGADTTTTPTTVDTSWLGADAKPEIATYIQGKGFKGAQPLAEAYMNAEKALSSRQFEVPKAEDAAGWQKINAARGVPEAPDKYDFGDAGKALKPEALQQWGGMFHQLGLTNDQAAKLVAQTTAMTTKAQEDAQLAYIQGTEQVAQRMQVEMGDKWPAFHDIASRGFTVIKNALKIGDDKVDALERALGTRELMSLAHMIGEAKVEAGFISSDGQHRGMTKDQARAAINGFKADASKSAALTRADHPGHAAALSEWQQLRRIAEG